MNLVEVKMCFQTLLVKSSAQLMVCFLIFVVVANCKLVFVQLLLARYHTTTVRSQTLQLPSTEPRADFVAVGLHMLHAVTTWFLLSLRILLYMNRIQMRVVPGYVHYSIMVWA
jgi:hypothetical protein